MYTELEGLLGFITIAFLLVDVWGLIGLAVIVIFIIVAVASDKSAQEYQKAKADVESAFSHICRLLEALDILESVLATHDEQLYFYRNIATSLKTDYTVFELEYVIIRSGRNPAVKELLDSIIQ